MMTRALAADLAAARVTVVSIHPGWLRTDMGGDEADVPADEAAATIVETVDGLGLAHSGSYMDRDGTPHPW
jgi:NAD(P)-dependent dehydrogenase (short-subunit alcohol dehydrogenase family)